MADLLALVCDVYCDFDSFPLGILGQVWHLIVSTTDLCCLSYFVFLFTPVIHIFNPLELNLRFVIFSGVTRIFICTMCWLQQIKPNNVVTARSMYYIDTLKREYIDTNAYKTAGFLSDRVVVDGHGCHTALHFGVKTKENIRLKLELPMRPNCLHMISLLFTLPYLTI